MKYMFYRCFSALNAELPSMDKTSRSPFCSLTSTKHITNKEHLAKTLDERNRSHAGLWKRSTWRKGSAWT